MKTRFLSVRSALAAALIAGVTLTATGLHAQQTQMTVEELASYIQKQKELLNEAIANRDETKVQIQEVQEAISEQDARRAQLENEVEELCQELEAANPGSYDDCKARYGS